MATSRSSNLSSSTSKTRGLTNDLALYTVGWNDSELGPYRSKTVRSPTKVKFDLELYKVKEYQPSFGGEKERSPTSIMSKSSKSSKSTKSTSPVKSEPASPPKQVDLETALYSTGSVLTRMQSDHMVESLDDYNVGWNKMELYTSSSPNPSPSPEKTTKEINKKGYVRTDSFQISPDGQITYH